MDENVYNLKLHESTTIRAGKFQLNVVRVPGGWIYFKMHESTGTFVPYVEPPAPPPERF